MSTDVESGESVNIELLKLNPCFASLDDCVLESIGQLMSIKMVQKNEIIWLEEQTARNIYFIESGLIKLFKTSANGKEQILRLVGPGDCFGHAGAFNGGTHPESAQAVVSSVLYGLTKNNLEIMVGENRQLALNIIKLLATEMHHYISLVEDLSLRCVQGRLARMLLTHNVSNGGTSQILTRSDIAAMTGTVREVIGKSLKDLEDKGAIKYNRREIVIKDRETLESIMLTL